MRRIVGIVVVATCLWAASTVAIPSAAPPAQAAAAHPRLLFGAEDVADLRTKVQSGVPADLWRVLQTKAETYLDRTEVRYVDPADPHTGEQNAEGVFLTDLSFAYLISGDDRYGRHAIDMLLQLAAQGWPAWNSNELGRGDLTKGVALAFDWTYDLMTEAERKTIVDSLVAGLPTLDPTTGVPRNGVYEPKVFSCLDLDHPWLPTSSMNWNGVCGGGNGLTLLALEGEAGVPDLAPWLSVARAHVARYWSSGFGARGDGAEGHTYAAYGLHNSLPFAMSIQRLKGDDLFSSGAGGVRNLVEWLAYEQLPRGGSRFVPRNDSTIPAPLQAEIIPFYFAVRPGDGLTGWLWDHTVGPDGDDITAFDEDETQNPAWPGDSSCALPLDHEEAAAWTLFCARSSEVFSLLYYASPTALPRIAPGETLATARHYGEYGLANFRTGWDGPDELLMTFEAKRRANGHSQLDSGSFTLYGHDAMFAVDSGYGHNYSCANNLAAQLALGCTATDPMIDNGRAIGHNVVLTDNSKFSQSCCGRSTLDQTIPLFLAGVTSGMARADVKRSYVNATLGAAPWAERDVAFRHVADEPTIVVVADRMRRTSGATRVTYQWTMHSDVRNQFSTDGTAFRLQAPSGAVLTGATGDANGATVVYGEPWDATRYNATAPLVHTVVKSTTLQQQDFDHLAVLGVSEAGGPEVTVGRIEATGGTVLAASWPGSEVLVASKAHEAPSVASPGLSTDAAMAMVSVDRGETTLVDGSTLVAGGRSYATVTGGRGSAVVGGRTVEASGPAGATFRVYAPQAIDTVTLNGSPVTFGRDGDEIVFPASVPQVSAIAVSPPAAGEGEPVQVSAQLASGPLPVTSCTIDHGDATPVVAGTVSGSTCTGAAHVYADDGLYAVRVRATNAVGEGVGALTHPIVNRAPVVAAPIVAHDASGHLVTASATFSDAGAADGPYSCAVDYGDGLGAVPGVVSGSTCTGPTHLYRRPGLYAVTAWVTDKDGGTGARAAPYDLR